MQLHYRGQTYSYSPTTLPSAVGTHGLAHTLFYRGVTYNYQCATVQPAQAPKTINWRYRGVSERQQQILKPAH